MSRQAAPTHNLHLPMQIPLLCAPTTSLPKLAPVRDFNHFLTS
jgi:hypothetical protein